jgi:hypothetical protein
MYEQAISVVRNIKNSNKVDYQNSWKLITFFVGGNDLCKSCKDVGYFFDSYQNNIFIIGIIDKNKRTNTQFKIMLIM